MCTVSERTIRKPWLYNGKWSSFELTSPQVCPLIDLKFECMLLFLFVIINKFSCLCQIKNCISSVSAHHNLVHCGDIQAMKVLTFNPGISGFAQMEPGKFKFTLQKLSNTVGNKQSESWLRWQTSEIVLQVSIQDVGTLSGCYTCLLSGPHWNYN